MGGHKSGQLCRSKASRQRGQCVDADSVQDRLHPKDTAHPTRYSPSSQGTIKHVPETTGELLIIWSRKRNFTVVQHTPSLAGRGKLVMVSGTRDCVAYSGPIDVIQLLEVRLAE